MHARLLPPPAAFLVALALALPAVAGAATHTVVLEGMKMHPETLTVKPGDRIVWQNKDVVPHTATAAGVFDSKSIAPGKSWSVQAPKKAGKYDYVCTFHPGIKATLVVQ
jgi:plastocyanin